MKTAISLASSVSPRQIVAAGLCIGCGSCVAQSGNANAGMVWDRYGQLKPDTRHGLRDPSAALGRTCPFAPAPKNEDELASALFPAARHIDRRIGRFDMAYVGHVEETDFRERGSSGGMVSWMAAELLRRNLVDGVAHVSAVNPMEEHRFFRYGISRTVAEIRAGSGSRYYPVDLSEVLRTIRATPGRYAVVGIPCFIKAVNLLRAEDETFRQRIVYTLGLFCGHMKSARFVESIARQAGVNPDVVAGIDYRVKAPGRQANWYRARLSLADGSTQEKDWWHLADGDWGAGFFQNAACNFCDDVVAETADIAFGDAWVEPYSSDSHGTNVVIVRKPELGRIVRTAVNEGRLELRQVGAGFIKETQAAGLRQRREGLAYRLAFKPPVLPLQKRIEADASGLPARRKLIYRMRYSISRWSHRIFALARITGLAALYTWWARAAVWLYHGLAYSRGVAGRACDALLSNHSTGKP